MGIAAPPICQDLPDADPDSFEPKAPGDGDGNPGSGSDSDSSSSSEDPYSNKAQLYKYFSGKGPTKMVATFLQDERLKLICIIICLLSEPLEEAYAKNQETMQSGPPRRHGMGRGACCWLLVEHCDWNPQNPDISIVDETPWIYHAFNKALDCSRRTQIQSLEGGQPMCI